MIYVIGGANIDLFAKSDKELIMYDSNPARLDMGIGGVGRNIAENLINIGEDVEFMTIFANDYFGDFLYQDCKNKGFKLNYSLRKADQKTSMYLAVLDHENDMQLAFSDMCIIESLNAQDLKELKRVIQDDDYLIVDTNLNLETYTYIMHNFKGIKVSDAISVNKVYKLKDLVDKIDIIKVNLKEAEALIGNSLKDEEDIVCGLKELFKRGAKEVLITTKLGVYLLKDNKIYYYVHNSYSPSVNTTGAGDSMLAAYVYASNHKYDIENALAIALSTAILTIHDYNAVAKLDINRIINKRNELKIEGGVVADVYSC